MAYSLEYNGAKGICFFTDFLVVGENQQTFDLEGDSGSPMLLTAHNQKPRPVGIILGGTANRGRLKLNVGQPLENWTSGVDLGRLLDLLELDLVTSNQGLHAAVQEQIIASTTTVQCTFGECSSQLNIQAEAPPLMMQLVSGDENFNVQACSVEHQFIPSFPSRALINHSQSQHNFFATGDEAEGEISVSLHLGEE